MPYRYCQATLKRGPYWRGVGSEEIGKLVFCGIVVSTAPDGLTESATKAAYEMLGDVGNNRVYGDAIVDGLANLPEEGRPWRMKSSNQR